MKGLHCGGQNTRGYNFTTFMGPATVSLREETEKVGALWDSLASMDGLSCIHGQFAPYPISMFLYINFFIRLCIRNHLT